MKASELIKELQKFVDQGEDLEVCVYFDKYRSPEGGSGFEGFEKIDIYDKITKESFFAKNDGPVIGLANDHSGVINYIDIGE